MLAALRIFARIRNFHISSKDNDARPIVVTSNVVSLYADQRILPHPFNLPPQRGKAVQAVGVIGEIDGNNIRPVVTAASKSAVAEPHQHLATSLLRIVMDNSFRFAPAAKSCAHTPKDERIYGVG